MARQVRIEFPGAFYHVMARGNRLNPIFVSPDGADEELFLKTLGEACERSTFRVWAWVLMHNHYHLVLETPKANLVTGMGWLQNTYTRRFNTRHKAWGRLFGDRYKSILIDDDRSGGGSSYLATLLDYVHLNPARAKLIGKGVRLQVTVAFSHIPPNLPPCLDKSASNFPALSTTSWHAAIASIPSSFLLTVPMKSFS